MNRWRGGAVALDARPQRLARSQRRAWRPRACAWLLAAAALLAGCPRSEAPLPGGPRRDPDAAVFQACDSVCVRPGDCARTYNDDGICPAGFLCVLRYSGCNSD
jgi:hypothetical protein